MSEEKTLSEAIKILSDFVRGNDIEDHPLPCERYSLAQIQQALAARDRLIEQLGDALNRLAYKRHYHVRTDDGDVCGHCGFDLRDNVHLRVNESATEEHIKAWSAVTSALAAYRQLKEDQNGHQD